MVLTAPAKLTWDLHLTGRRPDGYHLLRSEMVSLDLVDTLEIEEANDTLIHVTGEFSDGVPLGSDNLVRRALDVVSRTAHVLLTKSIPTGGGLGGGSADAAAILRWAGVTDPDRAARLGGDVPFCLRGGRALVEGVGEVLTPLEFVPREVTVALLPFGVDTAACYREFDAQSARGANEIGRNELRSAAEAVCPSLVVASTWLEAESARSVHLCGSGSSLFVEGWLGLSGSAVHVDSPVGRVTLVEARTVPAY
jgi:4-diphosphocytidyl-2-C-methyl-D-erythritol kinase